ncbi:MAG: restriction endonuclease, partial [Bacteroidetes bacterium QH_2_63_10]
MDLTEKISALQSSAQRQLPALTSLKKMETALILPFFNALGYDPFDVREIEPDFEMGV